jgi:hypothetical protein
MFFLTISDFSMFVKCFRRVATSVLSPTVSSWKRNFIVNHWIKWPIQQTHNYTKQRSTHPTTSLVYKQTMYSNLTNFAISYFRPWYQPSILTPWRTDRQTNKQTKTSEQTNEQTNKQIDRLNQQDNNSR